MKSFLFFFFFFLNTEHADDYVGGISDSFFVLHAALKWFAINPVCCQIFSGKFARSALSM